MVASLQTFVRRQFFPLLMALIGAGFVMLFVELLLYSHYQGLQIVGTAATVLGAIAAFLGIGARGNLRVGLAILFIVLALTGLLGAWEHNESRFEGEGERRPPAAAQAGEAGEAGEAETPPPPLAPLSLSGFCALGALGLLGKRDE